MVGPTPLYDFAVRRRPQDKRAGVQVAFVRCARELASVRCPTGPELEKLVARLMKVGHLPRGEIIPLPTGPNKSSLPCLAGGGGGQCMNGPHEYARKEAGRTLGALLVLAVEHQKQQGGNEASVKRTGMSKDIVWTLQSTSAYLAFLYKKSTNNPSS